jgi:hypothetical protein
MARTAQLVNQSPDCQLAPFGVPLARRLAAAGVFATRPKTRQRSGLLQLPGLLAVAVPIVLQLEADPVALVERTHAGGLDG